jgi:hypothetical protein
LGYKVHSVAELSAQTGFSVSVMARNIANNPAPMIAAVAAIMLVRVEDGGSAF